MTPTPATPSFRANVAALVMVGDAVLACERAGGEGWQCVQGGVEPEDATFERALVRELGEELGIEARDVEILARSRHWRRYRFPAGVSKRPGLDNAGQEQLWFHVRLPSLESVRLERSCGEFRSVKLTDPAELVSLYVSWKRAVVLDFCRERGLLP